MNDFKPALALAVAALLLPTLAATMRADSAAPAQGRPVRDQAAQEKPAQEKPTPDPAKNPAALAKACDDAAGMPADAQVASPDVSLLGAADARADAPHLEAVVAACTAAAAADLREGRFQHRLGIAFVHLRLPAEATAAYRRAMEAGNAGGFDEIANAHFSGSLAPALAKDGAAGIEVATKGIAATGNPEIKRDLATFLAEAPAPFGDQPRARKLLEEAAAQNHGPAMAELAGALAEGKIGFAKDPARAKKLLDAAIAAGSRSATYELALLTDNGVGVPGDPKAARALYLKAAEMGDLLAMTSISVMMRAGDGGPRDVEGGRKWLAREAAHGRLDAQRHLGSSYLHDDPRNTGAGITLMTLASQAGDRQSTFELGEIFKDGLDVQRDAAKAMEWYRKAADAGEPKAWERIGSMHDYGEGVPVDHAEARKYYDKAMRAGVANAFTDIGMQYDHAMGVPRDVVQAFDWYRRGADLGSSASISNLGYAYESGRGVRKDLALAVKWYTKAAQLDDANALHNLANMYLDGEGVKKDKLTGFALMRKAADHGHAMSLNDLALMEMKEPRGDGRHAVAMLRRAAADKVPIAYLNLAQALADGWDGRRDFVEANYWYAQAIANPSDLQPIVLSESQFHLGENMLLGRGIKRDVAKGRALIAAAVRGGNPTARAYVAGRRMPQTYRR